MREIAERFRNVAPTCDGWTVRVVRERVQGLHVRQDVLLPVTTSESLGAMVTVQSGAGLGYAATSDLSRAGLSEAGTRALGWAEAHARGGIAVALGYPAGSGTWRTPVRERWESRPLADQVALLTDCCRRLARGEAIVDRQAALELRAVETLIADDAGTAVEQSFSLLVPYLSATAHRASESQTRSFGFEAGRQGGLEQLDALGFAAAPERIGDEALELLAAEDCPSGSMDLLLMPSQMTLQIHESIGHPLELDRILGDERNYAGGSFVTSVMFGSYRYGSELLNVTFDPTRHGELASYGWDDEGTQAERLHLIERGMLVRGLGGGSSQRRSGLPGVANARACSWNRPPIDRMANLNLEPGTSSLDGLIRATARGVLMETNRSWSIDDRRNKFQFGCERGRMIVDGELKQVVKNPNYRGVSATFWRNLVGVGDAASVGVHGTPNCGKGEPNQVIHVGHASPPCRFAAVDVFGGG
jgi:predicted Zn-dependent protease